MKKLDKWELLYILLSVFIASGILISFFGSNIILTRSLNRMEDRTLPIKEMGNFTKLELPPYQFKDKICPEFSKINILSDSPDDPELASPGSCVFTYRGVKHLLMKNMLPDTTVELFKALGEPYNKMSFQEIYRTVMEARRPDPGWLILSQDEIAKTQIYLLERFNSYNRIGKEILKYQSGDNLIYRILTSSFEKEWVIFIGKDARYECAGPYCLEYFQRINLVK